LLSVGIYLLIRFVAAASPRLGSRSSSAANTQVRTVVLVAVLLFELIVQLCVTAISLGMRLDILFALNLAMAVLFIVIGNFMGKMRRNFWMGIRTPWTLTRIDVPQNCRFRSSPLRFPIFNTVCSRDKLLNFR
jgi:uncharacterized membrane protein